VNFFGHAVVASWETKTPGFVLGAMLPDFATMSGTRLVEVNHPELRAGVALHHRTDRVFHGNSHFVALCREAIQTLLARGLGRGRAHAVGHVGVELLLDGWLVERREAREAYAAALHCGRDRDLGRRIRWLDEEGRGRWRSLRRRLEGHGPPEDYRDPAVVASRVERILRGRRRLALDAGSLDIAARYLPELQRSVHTHAAPLIGELRQALADEIGMKPHGDGVAFCLFHERGPFRFPTTVRKGKRQHRPR
jgi:hypothetical protein